MRPRLVSALLAVGLHATAALAQTGAGDARASFTRAVSLYADGNYEAALVEFQRAHSLSRNANLLYNLGATYEALGRFVEARDALTAYRMSGTPATVAQRSRELDERLGRLRERIGTLRVTAPTPGLRVTLDGRELDADRARGGTPVSAGPRRVRLEAPGHVPREVVVDVAGGGDHVLSEPLEVQRAPLTLRTDTEGAAVSVDGAEVARTPLDGPLMLTEGNHRVEVTRPGYVTWRHEVVMGTAGVVMDAPLEWEPAMLASVAATLRLTSNAELPTVTIDGRSVVADGTTRVPPGPHQLRVACPGFVPAQRPITLTPGENRARVWLDATSALREEHAARVRRQRIPAYVIGGVGLAALAGGAVLLATGLSDRSAADEAIAGLQALESRCLRAPGDPGCGGMDGTRTRAAATDEHQADLNVATARAIGGIVAMGVGVAGVVVGTVLLLRADPADRYERPANWDVSLGPGGASLRGTF